MLKLSLICAGEVSLLSDLGADCRMLPFSKHKRHCYAISSHA